MNNSLFALGLVVLIVGILAGFVGFNNGLMSFGYEDNRPYSGLAIPLVITGILLMIAGAIVPSRTVITERSHVVPERRTRRVIEEG